MNYFEGRDEFVSFLNVDSDDKCMDISSVRYSFVTDEKGKELVEKISGCKNVAEFQKLDKKQRNLYIQELKKEGLSVRQISRLTGVSKSIVGQGSVPCPGRII